MFASANGKQQKWVRQLQPLGTVVTRMVPQNQVGHLMFITQRYTLLHAIFKKWGNRSKRQLCKEKNWIQGLAPKRMWIIYQITRVQVLRTTYCSLLFSFFSYLLL